MEKHFCVEVYVVDPKKEKFLLLKHKEFNKWLPSGGHIKKNESPDDAATREVFEETGLKIELVGERLPRRTDLIRPLAMQTNIIKQNEHIHMDFIYIGIAKDEKQELVLNDKEEYDIKWFTYNEIMNEKFDTYPDVRYWCKDILEKMWDK
jgi:8-oxo-dGTP pyrophosphatase MutT (NUDIX family)